ncbi:MAG: hypothetical protein KF841_03090 [Phycisphaerae bacterium]|nr:hypothetical protein [Phycisphaerae bacterium]
MLRTDRDNQIIEALACCVRLFSLQQLAESWWRESAEPTVPARRRLSQLVSARWLSESHVHAGPLLNLSRPMQTWAPGELAPDCERIARALAQRWASSEPPERLTVFVATKIAHREFGGPPKPKRLDALYATHDLNLATVYLHFRRHRPRDADAWVGEDLRPKAGFRMKDPDAVLEYADGQPDLVIELGGKYSRADIQAFHDDCDRRGRRYELW